MVNKDTNAGSVLRDLRGRGGYLPPPTPAGDISVAYLGQDVSADRSQTRVAIQTEKKVAQKTHVQDRARATARPSAPRWPGTGFTEAKTRTHSWTVKNEVHARRWSDRRLFTPMEDGGKGGGIRLEACARAGLLVVMACSSNVELAGSRCRGWLRGWR